MVMLAVCLGAVPLWAQDALPAEPSAKPAPAVEAPVAPRPALLAPQSYPLNSIFFTTEEREAIALAKKQYLERDLIVPATDDLLDQLQGIKAQRPQEDFQEKFYAQFYLETLIYHTPKDWTVWVKENDKTQKYTASREPLPADILKVISIRSEDVTFEWKPKNWNYVNTTFKPGNPNIQLDTARQVVIFTMRVNQTMQSSEMAVKEGIAAIVPVSGTTPAPAPVTVPAPAAPAVPAVPPEQKKPATGVLGLYKELESPDKQPQNTNPPAAEPAAP